MRLYLVVKLKYESSTIIFFVGIRYSMFELLSDSITMPDLRTLLQTSDMRQIW